VKARRHSSASRESEDEKKAKKNAILRNAERRVRALLWGAWGGGCAVVAPRLLAAVPGALALGFAEVGAAVLPRLLM